MLKYLSASKNAAAIMMWNITVSFCIVMGGAEEVKLYVPASLLVIFWGLTTFEAEFSVKEIQTTMMHLLKTQMGLAIA